MQNKDLWQPSKFVITNGRLCASGDRRAVSASSWLMANLLAGFYGRYLPHYCRGKLLDLGCGYVPLYEGYKDLVEDNVCVDWPNSLHDNTFLDHEFDLTQPIPLSDGGFDTILLSDVLEHIPNPELLWSEMARLLKPKGKLFLNVPFYYWIHEHPFDYYRYTRYALERFAGQASLTILVLEELGGSLEILTDIHAKHLAKLPLLGEWLAACSQYLCFQFIQTGVGRRLSRKTAKRFPFGYFMVVEKA